jgi:hypothetical protein
MIKIIHKIAKNKIYQSEHQFFSKNGFMNATGQFSMLSNSEVKFPSCVEEQHVSGKEYPIEKISDDSPLKASEAEPLAKQGNNVNNITNRIGGSKSVSRNSAQCNT